MQKKRFKNFKLQPGADPKGSQDQYLGLVPSAKVVAFCRLRQWKLAQPTVSSLTLGAAHEYFGLHQ